MAELSGFDIQSQRDQVQVIRDIVHDDIFQINKEIQCSFVGMESRVDDLLRNYIYPEFGGVHVIGIHGMRGVGKTTLSQVVYHRIRQHYQSSCFLSSVRERFKNQDGLLSLQKQLLSEVLPAGIGNIDDHHKGEAVLKERLRIRKLLLVIDDVDELKQLQGLAGSREWFGPGSRIIITTTDVHLLEAHCDVVDIEYEATGLNYGESLALLSLKAFKESDPPEDYLEFCHQILEYACGHPLALEVIGSFLCRRSFIEWQSAIKRLRDSPERQIIDVLRVSFDGLGEKEKEIFLHIACFFKGKDRARVTQILDYCQLYADIGLRVLADKSLIKFSDNKLWMHNLLQEMGWDIIRQQSPNDPGKRSRLWSHVDIHNVLKRNRGTEAIQAMVMDLSELKEAQCHPEAFSKLSQLSILQIHNVHLPKGLTCLPNSSRLLEWTEYPLTSLPEDFESDELVELDLCYSSLEHLWKGTKNFSSLKFIKLCHSQNMVQTPDFTGVYNLERLDLEGCINLVRIHVSLGVLKRLIAVNLKDCNNLETLPDEIEMESLKTLILSNCSKVTKIPEFVGNMDRLLELCLDGTSIVNLPVSIGRLSGLSFLDLSNCKNLLCLPSTFRQLESLQKLNLSGCSKLGQQHVMPSWNHLLKHGCEVVGKYLPWSLPARQRQRVNTEPTTKQLPLSDYSTEETEIPLMSIRLPVSGLFNLTDLNISNCDLGDAAFSSNFGCFPSLVALNLSGNSFVKLPSSIKSFLKLENINLENCKNLLELSGLPSNSRLDVRADGCSSLEMLFNVSHLNRLKKSYFNFISCFKLSDNQESCTNTALEMLRTFVYQGISDARETFQIVIPGSQIPEWFDPRSYGSLLRVDLVRGWDHSRFIGFALCAVFVLDEHHRVEELDMHQFKAFGATHHLVCHLKLDGKELEFYGKQPAFRFSEQFCQVESDHLWMFYVSREKYFGTEWWCNVWSWLEFSFKTRGPGLRVKECAVRLIYEQDVQLSKRCSTVQEMNHSMTHQSLANSSISPFEAMDSLHHDDEHSASVQGIIFE